MLGYIEQNTQRTGQMLPDRCERGNKVQPRNLYVYTAFDKRMHESDHIQIDCN